MAKAPPRIPPRIPLRAPPTVEPFGAPTTNYGWTKPTIGGDLNAWGTQLNADLDSIDSTVHGVQTNFSATAPVMDGTAAPGTATTFARSDHVHPTDTSRYAASNPAGYITSAALPVVPVVSTTLPAIDGTATIGASGKWADGAHIHPTDTSRYAASNPSNFQTAAQVTASLANYLLLAGGTLTGALIPSQTAGITGTTTNNNANAGAVGEVISSQVLSASGITIVTGTPFNLTSIVLTPGDWDVSGNITAQSVAGNYASLAVWLNSTSATFGDNSLTSFALGPVANPSAIIGISAPSRRFVLSASSSIYLIGQVSVSGGSNYIASGYLWARRAR